MNPKNEVVVPWGAGSFGFRTRWEAALFRWIIRRWSGWTSWDYLRDEDRARAIKNRAATRHTRKRLRWL